MNVIAAATVIVLTAGAPSPQANIPPITNTPQVTTLPPALKKAVDSLKKECPTCVALDLGNGTRVWVLPPSPIVQAQIPELAAGNCGVPAWTSEEAKKLRTSIEGALTAAQVTEFHQKEPAGCDRQSFVYYLDIARQLLPKSNP